MLDSSVETSDERPVTFTFDDGHADHYLAAELMAPYGFRGTAYIIPSVLGKPGHLTLHQVIAMRDDYHWDIGSHDEKPFTELKSAELESAILGIQRFLLENKLGRGVFHLAYPLGRQDAKVVRPLVRKHFQSARVAGSGPETLPPADAHLLRVMNVTDQTPPERVADAVRQAKEHKEWLILMFHFLVEKTEYATQYSIENFNAVLQKVSESGIRVLPLTDVWNHCAPALHDATSPGPCRLAQQVAAPDPQ